jgi:eukaryotic-like serine/threonine-protein kinase
MRFQIPLTMNLAAGGGNFAVSPDGRELAFPATGSDGISRLWIRSLDSLEAHPLPGSESPVFPPFFWSPDSRYIVFDAGGKLDKIDIRGGPAQTLCALDHLAVGGSWNQAGTIIFGYGNGGGVMTVSANGGPAKPVTILDESHGEVRHDQPSFLPDGRHFIYQRDSDNTEDSGTYIGSLDLKPEQQDSKRLLQTAIAAAYVPSSNPGAGQLLFMSGGKLMAQAFDTRRLALSGEPMTVAEKVGSFLDGGFFSASTTGLLVYRAGEEQESRLVWFDRQGRTLGTAEEAGAYYSVAVSPNGDRAAVSRLDSQNPTLALWLIDFSRGTSTRFTFAGFDTNDPVWSPDGKRIIFGSNRNGRYDIYQKPASGAQDEELPLKSSEANFPTSWSHDGRFLLYRTRQPGRPNASLWVLPLEGDKKPFPIARTEFNEHDGQFSPDGHFIAYVSDESGRDEIYVREFSPDSAAASDSGGKWLISTGGGRQPRWSEDGKQLYYMTFDWKLRSVDIATKPEFRAGLPRDLFQGPPPGALSIEGESWALTPDGKRFLFIAPAQQGSQAQVPFTVVLNWQVALRPSAQN